MALFHLSVTQTKRSAGQSAIASAAYRSGEKLYSEYYGEYSDYTRKGGVICSDILLPSHAPPEYADIGGPYQRCGTHRKGDVRAIRQENGGPKPAVFQSSYSGMGTPLHN